MRITSRTYQILCWVSFLFISSFSYAQELNAYFNHQRVQLGEEIVLNLSVTLPKGGKLNYKPYEAIFPALTMKEGSQIVDEKISLEISGEFSDTFIQKGKSTVWIGKYSLIAWDTGKIIIPQVSISINDSSYLFNESSFTVIAQTIGVKDELFDIEEGFLELDTAPTLWQLMVKYWYYLALVVVLIIAIILFVIRNKKLKNAKKITVLSLKDRTLLAIDSLDKRQLWRTNQLKLHYTELSHIMRSYLSSRYDLNLLERTTFETKFLLQKKEIPADTIETFMTILRQSDMVKFANSSADEVTTTKVSLMAKQIVSETSPIELNMEE